MVSKLSTVEIFPQATHLYSIIWLHGLGADGHDFEGFVPELHLPSEAHIHFVFPHAPVQAVTINGGYRMRAWFDIIELEPQPTIDNDGLYRSAEAVAALIQAEIDKGIPSKNILLAGFSQGGSVVLHVGLRYPQPLAGIAALSTYLPSAGRLEKERSDANLSIPIIMAHGTYDPVIKIQAAKATLSVLQSLQYRVRWHEYPMAHTLCLEEAGHLAAFIEECFANAAGEE
jgi:phospholipase/carboxylesterase